MVVLGLPPCVVLVGVTHLVPRFWQDCAPLVGWDRVAGFALLGLLGAIGLELLARRPAERRNLYAYGAGCGIFALVVAGLWLHALGIGNAVFRSEQQQSLIWPSAMVLILLGGLVVRVGQLVRDRVVSCWLIHGH